MVNSFTKMTFLVKHGVGKAPAVQIVGQHSKLIVSL